MRWAPAGIGTFAPTAAILPLVIMTVPFSIGGPLTGYTLPPVIAIVWAAAGIASIAARATATAKRELSLYEIID